MAVFRVEKSKNYTTISNCCLRDTNLSLKAKGLLAQMLSLPEDWDYTMLGLAKLNKEGKDAIRAALSELEKAGYVIRARARDEHGRLRGADYFVYETPQIEESPEKEPEKEPEEIPEEKNGPMSGKSTQAPMSEKSTLENPTQLNKDIQSTDIKKEKINKKKESKPAAGFDPMLQIKNWIADQFGPAPAYDKNRLYFAFKGFVENREALKKPLKTKGAVTGVCNRLGRLTCNGERQLDWMIELLEDATSNNWQTVYIRGSPRQEQQSEGRHYEVI